MSDQSQVLLLGPFAIRVLSIIICVAFDAAVGLGFAVGILGGVGLVRFVVHVIPGMFLFVIGRAIVVAGHSYRCVPFMQIAGA